MATVCELQIAFKKKGIKGYSGLKKDELMKMLDSGKKPETKKQEVKKEPVKKKEAVKKQEVKKEPVKKQEPVKKNEAKKEEETPKFGNKPIEQLYKIIESLKKQIKDGANKIESARSVKFLDIYKTAYDFAIKKMKEDIKPKGKKTLKSMINKIVKNRAETDDKIIQDGLGIVMNLLYAELESK